jgi:hypothetical protein
MLNNEFFDLDIRHWKFNIRYSYKAACKSFSAGCLERANMAEKVVVDVLLTDFNQ